MGYTCAKLPGMRNHSVCALDGCAKPLPVAGRRGGRPARYCSKAHADAASRARRALSGTEMADLVAEVRRATEQLEPALRPVLAALADVRRALAAVEAGAVAQVRDAVRRAEVAEVERDQAVAAKIKAEERAALGDDLAATRIELRELQAKIITTFQQVNREHDQP